MELQEAKDYVIDVFRKRKEKGEGLGMVAPEEMNEIINNLVDGDHGVWLAAGFQLHHFGLIPKEVYKELCDEPS